MVALMFCFRALISIVQFFVIGTGGLVVFAGKNITLVGAALFYHHKDLADAAAAVSLPLICLAGDGLWYGAIWALKKEKVKATLLKLLPSWAVTMGRAFAGMANKANVWLHREGEEPALLSAAS